VELIGLERKDHSVVAASAADPGGGVTEEGPGRFAVSEQRPQGAESVVVFAALERGGDGPDVLAGDFAQVVVAVRSVQQQRSDGTEVAPDGVLVSRSGACAAVAERAYPVLDIVADAGADTFEFVVESSAVGGPVVLEQAEEIQDFTGASRVQSTLPQGGEQFAVAEPGAEAGQGDYQRAVDRAEGPVCPSPGRTEFYATACGPAARTASDGRNPPVGTPTDATPPLLRSRPTHHHSTPTPPRIRPPLALDTRDHTSDSPTGSPPEPRLTSHSLFL
jgi:hypothetical protein